MTPDLDVPGWFIAVIVGAYGLVLGSFLNVVIHRVPRGRSVFRPRSACPGCGRTIRWHENIPVLSWLLLRGRCAGCKNPIAWRYPAVEILTAALMLLALQRFGPTPGFLIAALFLLLLLSLVFIDLELMLLPDVITLPGTFVGLCLSFVSPFTTPSDALLGALVGLLVIESLNLAYKLLRGRDGMGAGDTKMMMMMGAFLGWQDVVVALVLAAFIGTLVAIPLLLLARRFAARRADAPPPAGSESPAEGGPAIAEAGPAIAEVGPAIAEAGRPEAPPEEAEEPEPPRASALLDLIPRTRPELLSLLTVLALAATFIVEVLDPARALAACLVGLALLAAAHRFVPRARPLASWLPLVGALVGAPPTTSSLAVAAGVLAATALLMRLLGARLPESLPEEPGMPREDDIEAAAEAEASPLMQAAIPFGVFLGVGGALALLGGDDLIEWYLSLAARLLGPA